MEEINAHSAHVLSGRKWSVRILAASLFGILFFTLFPYWADFTLGRAGNRSPFLLGGPLRFDGILHTFLNTLLFVPLGFALSRFFMERKNTFLKSLAATVLAGAALSYSIEILQLYIPSRDSAWDDLLANTLGAAIGAALASRFGGFVFRKLSEWEWKLEEFLTLRKLFVAALLYFAAWLAISVPLQQKTRLNNWDPNSFLLIGYDAKEDSRWSGKVFHLQLWDRALAANQAIGLSATRDLTGNSIPGALAAYDLMQPPPVTDKAGMSPNILLKPFHVGMKKPDVRVDRYVPISAAPLSALAPAVHQTNQLTVMVDCVAVRGNDIDGAIFAVTNLSGRSDLFLRQDHSALVITWRNGLEGRKAILAWRVPNVFATNVRRTIVFTYDGAQASVFVDDKKEPKSYYLSPGAGLVELFIRIKTDELVAYSVLYNSLVFLPIGFLLGLAARIIPRSNTFRKLYLALGFLIPAILLESLLVWISGRRVSILQLTVSIGLTIAGMVWMNLDSPGSALNLLQLPDK
jgi:glycopeptide antibiotics resistance protein